MDDASKNTGTAGIEGGRIRILPVVAFGLALILLSVFLNALIEARFDQTRVLVNLFSPTRDELLIRLLLLACELAFLAFIIYLLQRQNRLQNDLIRALHEKEQAIARSDAVLEAFGDAVSIQDRDLRVVYQNAAHRALMGDHLGETCYGAYQKRDDICPGCHLLAAYEDGTVHRRETSTKHSRRGEVQVEIVATPLFDSRGEIIAGIEAVRDISERKRNETLLHQARTQLEQRTLELSAANAELEAFGSSLAHDLRSHLAKIGTAAEILREIHGPALDADGRYCVATIASAGETMDALIQAIMILSRVSHRELRRESVDLSALAREVAQSLRANEPQRPVEFAIAEGLQATGDPALLLVVLENLLGNAWKYTRDRQPARIALERVERNGRTFFQVRDNGVGFDMAEAGKLFRPFGRLASGQGFPGVGIGLSTVQRIILRHGGEIVAESPPGGGAAFSFSLPG